MITLTPGERFGPYLVTGKLGSGGMGAVYSVQGPQGQELALKLLDLSQADEEGVARFQREAESHARVDRHPNVARIHGSGVVGVQPYLVMDLLPGGDLAAKLEGGPLSSDEVRKLGLDLAAGLAHIHARGVLHRDLKPANVLFDEQGRPRLTDFGLARPVEATSLTQSGVILGTPGFMAPEQASAGEVSPATDVFGLAATLYAALTGRPPFVGPTLFATLDQLLNQPAPPLPPEVPLDLRRAIERALAKEPGARFPDALSFRDGLRAEAPAAGDVRRSAGLAFAALALLGLVGAWALGAFSSKIAPATPLPTASVNTSPGEAPPTLTTWALDSARVLQAGRSETAKPTASARAVGCAWLGEHRFATLASNGVLSIWQPNSSGQPVAKSRLVPGVRLAKEETAKLFLLGEESLVWSSPKAPVQFRSLGGDGPALSLERTARATLESATGLLLFNSDYVAHWKGRGTTLDWTQEIEAPVPGWKLMSVDGLATKELLLSWASPSEFQTGGGGSVVERAEVGPGGLIRREEVFRSDSIVRSTYLERPTFFMGDRVGGLLAFRARDFKFLRNFGVPSGGSGVGMSRAHASPVYSIQRGLGGALLSLGGGHTSAPGDLRAWGPEGEALGRISFPKLKRCRILRISPGRRFALVSGYSQVALVPLEQLQKQR